MWIEESMFRPTEAETQWPPFCRRHFHVVHFHIIFLYELNLVQILKGAIKHMPLLVLVMASRWKVLLNWLIHVSLSLAEIRNYMVFAKYSSVSYEFIHLVRFESLMANIYITPFYVDRSLIHSQLRKINFRGIKPWHLSKWELDTICSILITLETNVDSSGPFYWRGLTSIPV